MEMITGSVRTNEEFFVLVALANASLTRRSDLPRSLADSLLGELFLYSIEDTQQTARHRNTSNFQSFGTHTGKDAYRTSVCPDKITTAFETRVNTFIRM